MVDQNNSTQEIRGYCSQCTSYCATIAQVQNGKFVSVRTDNEHPNDCSLCPKGLAGPELVYSKQRLQYPMKRTRPKSDPDPGWKRISWEEALDTIATRLTEIKARWGAESVAFSRAGAGGSPMGEVQPWVRRLAHAFGSPNAISTTHICQWHRDGCSAYTYGTADARADFGQTACILIWGNNPHATSRAQLKDIKEGLNRNAKLIIIDPRKTQLASEADLWLQVQPGTDGALALSMLNVMIEENLYDRDFVRDWTTAPFLVRSDNGNLLKASDLMGGGSTGSYVVADSATMSLRTYTPGTELSIEPALDAALTVRLADGEEIECRTAFRLLRERAAEYTPGKVEKITWITESKIREAVRMLAANRPACYYPYNGIEQSTNASQTNRAICLLYSLTGDYDAPGGNALFPEVPLNKVQAADFLSSESRKKRLGFDKRPLGPAAKGSVQAYEAYQAILTGKPYPVKALVGFGGNLVTSNAPSVLAKEALSNLEFHVQCELFLSPTAELADIVLPSASFWESWHVGGDFRSLKAISHVQLRPAVVPPQHDSRPDMDIIFELAKRLGLGDKFWNGDIEAAFNYHLAPTGLTLDQLKNKPGGVSLDLPIEYRKYSKKDDSGNFLGFDTPSKRVEVYSQTFRDYGYDPLPVWKEPITFRFAGSGSSGKYPLILINSKLLYYCHSQHRALPSLRKAAPYPFLEISPRNAKEVDCKSGDWLILETPHGSIRLQAKVTSTVPYNVVCTQNGWWQECQELNLPGFDVYSQLGANVNCLYDTDEIDPLSGSLPLKGYPCNVRKAS